MANIPQKCWSIPGFAARHDSCLTEAQRLAANLEWDPLTQTATSICGPDISQEACEALLFDDCRRQIVQDCERDLPAGASTEPSESDDQGSPALAIGTFALIGLGTWLLFKKVF